MLSCVLAKQQQELLTSKGGRHLPSSSLLGKQSPLSSERGQDGLSQPASFRSILWGSLHGLEGNLRGQGKSICEGKLSPQPFGWYQRWHHGKKNRLLMKSRTTQKRDFWNSLEIPSQLILLMNKSGRLKNTLINLRVVFRFVIRRKGLHRSPFLIRSQTSVHLTVNGFLKFHET